MVLWNWAIIEIWSGDGGLDNGELRLRGGAEGKEGNGQHVGQVDMTW